MVTVEKRIEEEAFSAVQTGDCDLFLLFDDGSLCFAVTDASGGVLLLAKYASESEPSAMLLEVFNQDPALRASYKSVVTAIGNSSFSFVPERLYDRNAAPQIYHHLLSGSHDGPYRIASSETFPFVTVFQVDALLDKTLLDCFPTGTIQHVTSFVLPVFQSMARGEDEEAVFAFVSGEVLYVVCFKTGELKFCNRFLFHSARDFLYFTLLVYKQFDLDPSRTPLLLSGSLLRNSSIYNLLYRYIRNVKFLEFPPGIHIHATLQKEPAHLFFGLLSMKACG